jgi:hypothetical protein
LQDKTLIGCRTEHPVDVVKKKFEYLDSHALAKKGVIAFYFQTKNKDRMEVKWRDEIRSLGMF